MTDDQIRNEDGRLELLAALYHRRTGAHSAETLRSVYLASRGYTLAEVTTWLSDLESYGYVRHEFAGISKAIKVWQITGAGITHKEGGRA